MPRRLAPSDAKTELTGFASTRSKAAHNDQTVSLGFARDGIWTGSPCAFTIREVLKVPRLEMVRFTDCHNAFGVSPRLMRRRN